MPQSFMSIGSRGNHALAMCVTLALSSGFSLTAKAADCAEGEVIELIGTVSDVYPNEAGTWTIAIHDTSITNIAGECSGVFNFFAVSKRPPTECRSGADVVATVVLVDVFLGEMAPGDVLNYRCE